MSKEIPQDIMSKIIAKAWKDKAFRKELHANPKKALKTFGIDVPDQVELKVLEEESNTRYLILPTPPANTRELSDQNLSKAAGGKTECLPRNSCF